MRKILLLGMFISSTVHLFSAARMETDDAIGNGGEKDRQEVMLHRFAEYDEAEQCTGSMDYYCTNYFEALKSLMPNDYENVIGDHVQFRLILANNNAKMIDLKRLDADNVLDFCLSAQTDTPTSFPFNAGNTLLDVAAFVGNTPLVREFFDEAERDNVFGELLWENVSRLDGPLKFAAINCHKKVIEFLLARGATFYWPPGEDGFELVDYPFHAAICYGNVFGDRLLCQIVNVFLQAFPKEHRNKFKDFIDYNYNEDESEEGILSVIHRDFPFTLKAINDKIIEWCMGSTQDELGDKQQNRKRKRLR